MKKFFALFAFIMILVGGAIAAPDNYSPFKKTLENMLTGRYDGQKIRKFARATYDVSTDGGSVGTHGLGTFLPANALITRSWYYVKTAFDSSTGTGTVALKCEDANNLYSAGQLVGHDVGYLGDGVSTGSLATMVQNIASKCEITATVGVIAQTAGKLNLFVEYVEKD